MTEHMEQPVHQRKNRPQGSQIKVGNSVFGGTAIPVIAGPCAVESYEQLQEVSITLKNLGLSCLRGGAYKPRTSPYTFQGMGMAGIELLEAMREDYGMSVFSEVMSIDQIEGMVEHIDCFQVGARNMQNFDLLKELGKQPRPVLLKRGLTATLDEFLWAAEYVLAGGNMNVILCERGIRSFDSATRNVLDLASVALLKEKTHLPVVVDPSHATGKRSLIAPCAKAAIAVGADGVIVEAHPVPEKSVSDAAQAISLPELSKMVLELKPVAEAVGRRIEQRKDASVHKPVHTTNHAEDTRVEACA